MSKSTLPRLKALREEMGKAGITAFIIPGTDGPIRTKASIMPVTGLHAPGFQDLTDRPEPLS